VQLRVDGWHQPIKNPSHARGSGTDRRIWFRVARPKCWFGAQSARMGLPLRVLSKKHMVRALCEGAR
jgi:hypothetical protein